MTVTLAAKRLRPKTYSFAIYLVIAVIFIQISALISVFWFRHRVVSVDTNAPELLTNYTPVMPPSPIRLPPLPDGPGREPGNLELPNNMGRLNLHKARDLTARIAGLNEEANKFRQQGEFKLAAAALLEAEKYDPRHATTLTNLALLAEAENQRDQAKAYWKRIVDLGPDLGTAYMLAKERLIVSEQPVRPATTTQPLFIESIKLEAVNNPGNAYEFNHTIAIGSHGFEEPFDRTKLEVKLFYYDQRNDGKVVPHTVDIQTKWQDDRVDWEARQTEVLNAKYTLPKRLESERKYYGFIFRISYRGLVQDQRVEPFELLQLFPHLRN